MINDEMTESDKSQFEEIKVAKGIFFPARAGDSITGLKPAIKLKPLEDSLRNDER